MKKRVLRISGHQKARLTRLQRRAQSMGNHLQLNKILAILLSANISKPMSSDQIAKELGVSRSRVNEWLKNFELHDVGSIVPKKPPGRPKKLSENQTRQLKEVLKKSPKAHGLDSERWNYKLLGKFIQMEFSLAYHPGHLRRILNRHGRFIQKNKIAEQKRKRIERVEEMKKRR